MAEEFPGGGRRSQPTVLVSGAAADLLAQVQRRLLAERVGADDGAVVVTTRDEPGAVVGRLTEEVEQLDADRLAIVDCTACDQPAETVRDGLTWSVRSPVAFEPTGEGVRAALSTLSDRGTGRIHFLFDTLTSPFRLAGGDDVLDHAHELAMTVGGYRGLGLFTVEEPAVTARESERLQHLVDIDVSVRRVDDAVELRWSGLLGGSDGWVGLGEASPLDAPGMNVG